MHGKHFYEGPTEDNFEIIPPPLGLRLIVGNDKTCLSMGLCLFFDFAFKKVLRDVWGNLACQSMHIYIGEDQMLEIISHSCHLDQPCILTTSNFATFTLCP